MPLRVVSFLTSGPQWLLAAPLQFQGFLCKTTEDGLSVEPSPAKHPHGLSGLRREGAPLSSLQPIDWGNCYSPGVAERNGVSETRGASLSSGRTSEGPDTITHPSAGRATHRQQRLGNHGQTSCPTVQGTIVKWYRPRSFSSIIVNVEKILFLWLCKLAFDFIQKKKKATIESQALYSNEFKQQTVTSDDAQGKLRSF